MNKRVLGVLLTVVLLVMVLLSSVKALEYNSSDTLATGSVTTLKTETTSTTASYTLYPKIALNSDGEFELTGTPVTVQYSNSSSYTGWFYKSGNKIYKFTGVAVTPAGSHVEYTDFGQFVYYSRESVGGSSGSASGDSVPQTSFYVYDTVDLKSPTNVTVDDIGSGFSEQLSGKFYTITTNDANTYAGTLKLSGSYGFSSSTGIVLTSFSRYVYGYKCVTVADPKLFEWQFAPVSIHTVTFNFVTGASNKVQSVASGHKVTPPAEPIKEFYTFKGWKKVS